MTNPQENRPELPDALARVLARDFAPVRPVSRFEVRAGVVGALALLPASLLLWHFGLRDDIARLPLTPFFVVLTLRVFAGLSLILLALREAIPSFGWPDRARTWTLFSSAGALFLLPEIFAILTGFAAPRPEITPAICFPLILGVSIPSLAAMFVFLGRAYPLQPVLTGCVAGLGGGMLAEAAQLIVCSNPAPIHGMAVHGSAPVVLALLGALGGWMMGRARLADRLTDH